MKLLNKLSLSIVLFSLLSTAQSQAEDSLDESNSEVVREELEKDLNPKSEGVLLNLEKITTLKRAQEVFDKLILQQDLTKQDQQLLVGAGAAFVCCYLMPPVGFRVVGQTAIKGTTAAFGAYVATKLANNSEVEEIFRERSARFVKFLKEGPAD